MNKDRKENEYDKPAYSYPILLVITILIIMITNIDRSEDLTNSKNANYEDAITTVENVDYDSTSVYYVNTETK
jgi:hypothetical protein